MRRSFFIYGGVFALAAALAWGTPLTATDPIRDDLDRGRADSALEKLSEALGQNPSDAEAHNLRCRVYYQEMQWDQAIADCAAAVRAEPGNSNYHLWLGRAYGQKAERASLFSAYGLARRLNAEFQQAVQLDPRNDAALADLGEYDVEAPAIVGGGLSRAEALVPQLQAVNAVAALGLDARIAESRKNYDAAETDLKGAIAQSPSPAGPWMDLAAFYRRRGRIDDMVNAAHTGASLDQLHGPALVDGADNLIKAHREPQTAIQWLQQYLDSTAQSEDAPSFAVRAQLAHLLADQGDAAGAEQQIAAAHALASGYRRAAHGFQPASGG